MNDAELLQRYSGSQCDAAFTELVNRYVDLVYCSALRQLGGDTHLAEDVTQTVFIDLARKAPSLSGRTLLAGWLYTSTRYAAAKAIRSERRWHSREQEAISMQQPPFESTHEPAWEQIHPVLDSVMHELKEPERNAVLLRYFERKHLVEVGAKLGLSEDAARKRVGRALEKLRELLAKRGVTSSTTALATLLSNQAITAAPAGIAVKTAAAAIASAASGTATVFTFFKTMTITKLKAGAVSALIVVGAAAPLIIQHQSQVRLRAENQALRQANLQMAEHLEPLAAENVRLSNVVAYADKAQLAGDERSAELLRLRAEVGRLRSDAQSRAARANASGDAAIEETAKSLAARASQLKERLEQMPGMKIPELQFLTQKDWLDAVSSLQKLESDQDFRQGLKNLRSSAKANFGQKLQQALHGFVQASGGMLPTDMLQLQPYFDAPVDPGLLGRYQIMQTGQVKNLGNEYNVIAEIAPPVDEEYDTRFQFGLNGRSSSSVNQAGDILEAAATAYANFNNGSLPRDASELSPYLQKPVEAVRIQEFLSQIPPGVTNLAQFNQVHQ